MKLLWAVQSNCVFNCKYCYFKIQNRISDKTTLIIRESEIEKLKNVGIDTVIISGAEPFIFQNWIEISYITKKLGLKTIITTNGSLITENVVEKINQLKVDGIIVSLDSYKSAYHNYYRSHFNETVNGIKNLVKSKNHEFKIGICCVVTSINWLDLINTLRFSIDLGIDYFKFQLIHVPHNYEEFRDLTLKREEIIKLMKILDIFYKVGESIILPDRDKIEFILKMLIENNIIIKKCWAGKKLVFLNEKKILYPCPTFADKFQSKGKLINKILDFNDLYVSNCHYFSTDCACLWELAYQNDFV